MLRRYLIVNLVLTLVYGAAAAAIFPPMSKALTQSYNDVLGAAADDALLGPLLFRTLQLR